MRAKLYVSQIDDVYIQQNFKTFGDLFNQIPFLKGQWRFIEFTLSVTAANQKVPHGMSFTPKDVIMLSSVAGTATFNYDLIDETFIYVSGTLSGTAPMTVRAFIGRYTEDAISV